MLWKNKITMRKKKNFKTNSPFTMLQNYVFLAKVKILTWQINVRSLKKVKTSKNTGSNTLHKLFCYLVLILFVKKRKKMPEVLVVEINISGYQDRLIPWMTQKWPTGWLVKHVRVFLVPCKKRLVQFTRIQKRTQDKSLLTRNRKNTAMFNWSPCIQVEEKSADDWGKSHSGVSGRK